MSLQPDPASNPGPINATQTYAGNENGKQMFAALELDILVGVGVVVVVLDSPGLKGVDEGHEGKGANNILHQLVLAEGSVSTVMADDKPLQPQMESMGCQACGASNFNDGMHQT